MSGDDRDRTGNLLVANQALSQLSYVPLRYDSSVLWGKPLRDSVNDSVFWSI